MELGLSLGDPSKPLPESNSSKKQNLGRKNGVFDFRVALGFKTYPVAGAHENPPPENDDGDDSASEGENSDGINNPLQLNLLPRSPLPRRVSLPWSSDNGSSENGSSGNVGRTAARGLDVNRFPAAEEVTSANSVGSQQQFHLDFGVYGGTGGVGGKRDFEAAGNVEAERPSDDDENGAGNTRKKLRLSKDQAAFLEDSFKEHSTLNPKQKQALAKQLNLRPRQVEVWFQNRRARTKLKQTEVDCEYLKRCCETLTGENRRLQKELQDLRALKITNPFYMQLPATTLTMCPSCERVATAPPAGSAKIDAAAKAVPFPVINKPKFFPFSQNSIIHHNQPAAS